MQANDLPQPALRSRCCSSRQVGCLLRSPQRPSHRGYRSSEAGSCWGCRPDRFPESIAPRVEEVGRRPDFQQDIQLLVPVCASDRNSPNRRRRRDLRSLKCAIVAQHTLRQPCRSQFGEASLQPCARPLRLQGRQLAFRRSRRALASAASDEPSPRHQIHGLRA